MRKIILSLVAVLLIGACGVKPKAVDAPVGVDPAAFPKPYPARTVK